MADSKRVVVSMPDTLLKEIDDTASLECCNRSEFIRKAMLYYIKETKNVRVVEKMKKGYLEMAEINLTLAEIGLTADNETYTWYETRLSESE